MPGRLIEALESTLGVDEFIVSERRRVALVRPLGEGEERRVEGRELEAHLFVDHERGRGQSRFLVPPDGDLRTLVRDSAVRALSALGPSWRLRPPAAPARVNVSDVNWQRSLEDSIEALEEVFRSHLPSSLRVLEGEIELSRVDTRALLSNGFDNRYRSTEARVSLRLQAEGGEPVPLRMHARRRKDLRWAEELAGAEQRSLAAPKASAESGPCEPTFRPSTMTSVSGLLSFVRAKPSAPNVASPDTSWARRSSREHRPVTV
jgi:predicted Zn-dependent protease